MGALGGLGGTGRHREALRPREALAVPREALGGLGKPWEALGDLGSLARPWRALGALGRLWEALGKPGRPWKVPPSRPWKILGGYGRPCEALGIALHCGALHCALMHCVAWRGTALALGLTCYAVLRCDVMCDVCVVQCRFAECLFSFVSVWLLALALPCRVLSYGAWSASCSLQYSVRRVLRVVLHVEFGIELGVAM